MNHISFVNSGHYQALGTKSWLKVVDNENSPSYVRLVLSSWWTTNGHPDNEDQELRGPGRDSTGTEAQNSCSDLLELPLCPALASMDYLILTITLLCYKGRTIVPVLKRGTDPLKTLVGKGKVRFLTCWPDIGPLPTSLALVLSFCWVRCAAWDVYSTQDSCHFFWVIVSGSIFLKPVCPRCC